MSSKVRKAVIPVAGLGTRFLPVTKTVPKELLPIVDRPILMYIFDEIIASGIEDVVLISGRGKNAIEDFFDTSYELESVLEKTGKHEALKTLRAIKDSCNVISIRQKEALGLGHAVWSARPVIGDEPFALLLGDEIMTFDADHPPVTQILVDHYQQSGHSTVAVIEVPRQETAKYGIIQIDTQIDKKTTPPFKIASVVEKPEPSKAPSLWALPGRYVFDAKIFDLLATTKPGRNGEIQLSDAMAQLAQTHALFAMPITNQRLDAGDPLGYLKACVLMGLQHPEIGHQIHSFLVDLMKAR
jgi:UTP--glucose-1-phosphate uridylyltransferase